MSETRQPIVIFGPGGLGRELHALVEDINASRDEPVWHMLGWLDGDSSTHGTSVHDLPVLGGIDWLADHPHVSVVVAVGSPASRRRIVADMRARGHERFPQLVHPTAIVGRRSSIGEGTVICAHVTTTTDFHVGEHVLLNLCCTVAHDDVLGDFVTVAPGAVISGNVTIREGVDLGTNATVIQGLEIGEWATIGAGAVVTRSLPANVTAVGAPARPIKERAAGWHLGSPSTPV